ncbi:MAG TPA: type II toxin-antitoxin system VapC family toxin [Gaiellaceae bacterium]|nr:type II toxin-antitoxin system VapC family toxin [Gaiellaceae bacterium]
MSEAAAKRRRVVCDASALVALLMDDGTDGRWAADALAGADLAAPTLVPFETANVFRRLERSGQVGPDQAAQAHADLLDLAVEQWPYELLAARAWELRHVLSSYDASYVALAELLDVTLVTLDRRLASAQGLRCAVATP